MRRPRPVRWWGFEVVIPGDGQSAHRVFGPNRLNRPTTALRRRAEVRCALDSLALELRLRLPVYLGRTANSGCVRVCLSQNVLPLLDCSAPVRLGLRDAPMRVLPVTFVGDGHDTHGGHGDGPRPNDRSTRRHRVAAGGVRSGPAQGAGPLPLSPVDAFATQVSRRCGHTSARRAPSRSAVPFGLDPGLVSGAG